jgi:hypothetical protein
MPHITAIVTAIAVLLIIATVGTAHAQSIQCGIRPIPPIGCKMNSARCVCNAQGQCDWVFDC